MMKKFSPTARLLFVMSLLLLVTAVKADDDDFRIEKITAGFVYNFARLAAWRDLSEDKTIKLCVLADSNFFDIFQNLSGKKAVGRIIEVLEFSKKIIYQCHILFIDRLKESDFQCQSLAENKNLLTISNIPDFAHDCGIIGLYEEGNQLRFEINIDTVNKSKVRLSSYLYKLARIIRDSPG